MQKLTISILLNLIVIVQQSAQNIIEKYEIYEIVLNCKFAGNSYKDVNLKAKFIHEYSEKKVSGFYDGGDKFIIRFMPHLEGSWNCQTKSNIEQLNNKKGTFNCIEPEENNYGMVRVDNIFYFRYDDGSPYYFFGSTSYASIHQSEEVQGQTIHTLKKAPFNKIRMCVFPKWYEFNRTEFEIYPYEGIALDNWGYWKFNQNFFHHFEQSISQLNELGIECDFILFHPYKMKGIGDLTVCPMCRMIIICFIMVQDNLLRES